jgi:hypothetical protein
LRNAQELEPKKCAALLYAYQIDVKFRGPLGGGALSGWPDSSPFLFPPRSYLERIVSAGFAGRGG